VAEGGAHVEHVLVVPDDVEVDEVLALATCSFAGARAYDGDTVARDRSAREARNAQDGGAPATIRLSRYSSVVGPWEPEEAPESVRAALRAVGADTTYTAVYSVASLRERTTPVPFLTGDRDGLRRTFFQGAPEREEGRVVAWLVAAARRLTGSLVLDVARRGEPTAFARLAPDPAVDTDLTLVSDVWLTPEAAQALALGVDPAAEIGPTGFAWDGPPQTWRGSARGLVDDDALDDADLAALAAPPPLEGYSVLLPTAPAMADSAGRAGEERAVSRPPSGLATTGGTVAIEVTGIAAPPLALRSLGWLAAGGVQYALRWYPSDDEAAHRERPSAAVRAERRRAAATITALARTLHRAAGGELLDQSGFPLAPEDL